MRYAEIIVDVASGDCDGAVAALFEEGVTVEVRDESTLLKPPAGRARLIACTAPEEARAIEHGIATALRRAGVDAELRCLEHDDDAWLDGWKRWFKPRHVGPFVIVPSWEPYEASGGEILLHLDPGRAFGTGGHASTRLCLEAIGRAATAGAAPERALDVGCGSGVLAVAAALRWPALMATAIDIDADAIEVTRENAEKNAVTARVHASTEPLPLLVERGERYPLVLANITAETIAALSAPLAAVLAPGGRLVASGILDEQAAGVERDLAGRGLFVRDRLSEDGWTALVFAPA